MFYADVHQFSEIRKATLVAVLLCLGRLFTAFVIINIFYVALAVFHLSMSVVCVLFELSFAFSLD